MGAGSSSERGVLQRGGGRLGVGGGCGLGVWVVGALKFI
jgi:hypothetical protein